MTRHPKFTGIIQDVGGPTANMYGFECERKSKQGACPDKRCLYPATPHLAHTLWSELGYASQLGDLLDAPWPHVDASALVQTEIELVLQINGKLRGSIVVAADADRSAIEAVALASPIFISHAAGAKPKKVVVVPGRLVNVVV